MTMQKKPVLHAGVAAPEVLGDHPIANIVLDIQLNSCEEAVRAPHFNTGMLNELGMQGAVVLPPQVAAGAPQHEQVCFLTVRVEAAEVT